MEESTWDTCTKADDFTKYMKSFEFAIVAVITNA